MQTFLPYPDFSESARVLDGKRLRNQRNEALIALKQLLGLYEKGWPHSPAILMWRGYERSLRNYLKAICEESERRGTKDTVWAQAEALGELPGVDGDPPWIGDEAFHRAHRSNLLRKDPEHYGGLPGFDVPNDLPYVWPVVGN